jgi:hypothetical protein
MRRAIISIKRHLGKVFLKCHYLEIYISSITCAALEFLSSFAVQLDTLQRLQDPHMQHTQNQESFACMQRKSEMQISTSSREFFARALNNIVYIKESCAGCAGMRARLVLCVFYTECTHRVL